MGEWNVGDGVVCPPHGAGTVTAIAPREPGGEDFLSIRITHSKMTLMFPISKAESRGVRKTMNPEDLDALIEMLGGEREALPENRQQLTRLVSERANSGDVLKLAGVIRDLGGKAAAGAKLSVADARVFETAKTNLASELTLVKGIPVEEAMALIESSLAPAEQP